MPEKRIIRTRLNNKEEFFKMLALAEALRLPILLVGPPGTGKTNTLLDYAAAKYLDKKEAAEKSFIIEVDEGTKPTEIKGRINVETLVTKHKYEVLAPIIKSTFVLINEVDKASSSFRNSMLSCMNEKELMQGDVRVPLNWEVWAASCNEIPQDEAGNPFWDRFMIKAHVGRLSKTQLQNMLKRTPSLHEDSKAINEIEINVPSLEEINSMPINDKMLEKFIECSYNKLSDRTMTFVPNIVRALQVIHNLGQATAFVKAAEILTDITIANKLSTEIEPKELIALRQNIDKVEQIVDGNIMRSTVEDIKQAIGKHFAAGIFDEQTKKALVENLRVKVAANKFLKIVVKSSSEEELSPATTVLG